MYLQNWLAKVGLPRYEDLVQAAASGRVTYHNKQYHKNSQVVSCRIITIVVFISLRFPMLCGESAKSIRRKLYNIVKSRKNMS